MKKKTLVVFVLLISLIACIALTGCSLVRLNEERQANRIMATVSQELDLNAAAKAKLNELGISDYNVSLNITRRELISNVNYAVNYYSQLYSQYGLTYSYDAETVLNDTLDSMLSEKYYVVKAMEKLLNNTSSGRLDTMYMVVCKDDYIAKYGYTVAPEGVLTMSEWYNAMKTVEDTLQEQIDEYVADEEEDTRDIEISDADDAISALYQDGYFMSGIAVAHKVFENGEEKKDDDGNKVYADGLYQDSFVVLGEDESEVDYEKVYAKIEMKKEGVQEAKYVYRPISESSMTLEEVEDAKFVSAYITVKSATVSYTGRIAAEVTEETPDGYTSQEFTSDKVEYQAVSARSAYSEAEEEDVDYLEDAAVRYASKAVWTDVLATYNKAEKTFDEDAQGYDASLAAIYSEGAFKTVYETYASAAEKEAYRKLRSTLTSANIGYSETAPEQDAENYEEKLKNYNNYNGLYYYYVEQFNSEILSAVQYEIGEEVTDPTDAEIESEYRTLVKQDYAKYDELGYTDQISEFFKDSDKAITDISGVYTVPLTALLKSTYKVDATDKSYAALFEGGEVKAGFEKYFVQDEQGKVVTDKDGKYEMYYAYDNEDGTYTINAFFVAHILFKFDNVSGLADKVTAAIKDNSHEDELTKLAFFVESLKTVIQQEGYAKEGGEVLADVFEVDEDGNIKYSTVEDALDRINTAVEANGISYESILKAFLEQMVLFNDDSGAISNSGYLICSGLDTGFMQDFADTAREVYYNLFVAGVDLTDYTGLTDIKDLFGKGYTSYGMHYEYVCFAPYFNVKLEKMTVGSDEVYYLNSKTPLTIAKEGEEQTTHYDTLKEELLSTKKDNAYSNWKAEFTDEIIEKATNKNEKQYDKLLDEMTED